MVSDFTYLLSGYLSGYAILKFPFLWFFQNQLTLLLAQFDCPSRSFGYRPRTTCSGCWTVLAAIWFNIKLVSSVGSRFFRLLTVAINNYFSFFALPLVYDLWRLSNANLVWIKFCRLVLHIQQKFNFKLFDIVQNMPIVLQFVFVQTTVIAVARLN